MKHWCLEMTYSLIFLARHALPALLCPWKDTKQPSPNSRWKCKGKREGKANREKHLSFHGLRVQTHHNTSVTPNTCYNGDKNP